jgi:hypothetical protein
MHPGLRGTSDPAWLLILEALNSSSRYFFATSRFGVLWVFISSAWQTSEFAAI